MYYIRKQKPCQSLSEIKIAITLAIPISNILNRIINRIKMDECNAKRIAQLSNYLPNTN